MVRVQVVSAQQLSPRSLRAQDYILSPSHLAKKLVDEWVEEEGLGQLIRGDAPARRRLVEKAAEVIQSSIERAQACLMQPDRLD